ncbi:MAG: hypothetical protein J5741_08275 [Bacteroidales bacterium]|nr:hypothetical protein [Bacteroidales bacterium]
MEENTDIQKEIATTEEEVQITKTANTRRAFFIHLSIFILSVAIIWILWYLLKNAFRPELTGGFLKICLCFSLLWLIAVIFHYLIAFKWTRTHAEKEVSKLRKRRDQQIEEIKALKQEIQQNADSLKQEEERKE